MQVQIEQAAFCVATATRVEASSVMCLARALLERCVCVKLLCALDRRETRKGETLRRHSAPVSSLPISFGGYILQYSHTTRRHRLC